MRQFRASRPRENSVPHFFGQQLDLRVAIPERLTERRQGLEARAPAIADAQAADRPGGRTLRGHDRGIGPASVRRAPSSSAVPASVSLTSRLVRTKRVVPSSCSRWRIAMLSGGWAMCRRSAARLKLSSSATAMK
jgi:hypothetical protein